jgi:hypothetical protein
MHIYDVNIEDHHDDDYQSMVRSVHMHDLIDECVIVLVVSSLLVD